MCTQLQYYSPKEYGNGHARTPDRVSTTFFSRREERKREAEETNQRFKFRCRGRYAKIHRRVIRGKRRERAEVTIHQGVWPGVWSVGSLTDLFSSFSALLSLRTAILLLARLSRPSRSFCLPGHERERDREGTKRDRAFVSGMCLHGRRRRDRVETTKLAAGRPARTQGYNVPSSTSLIAEMKIYV